MRKETMQWIDREKLIAIVRGVDADKCLLVADALYAGGIRLMEITFNQSMSESFEQTASAIKAIGEKYAGRMLVGAGTVTTPELVELAASAGARFIISPDTNIEVIKRTLELGLVSLPGAYTPSEIMAAHNAGADYVKLFPIAQAGLGYIKAIRGPISHVKLMAVGGVNENNAADYIKAGMAGVGVGGNLANKTWIEAGEFDKLTEIAKKLTNSISKA